MDSARCRIVPFRQCHEIRSTRRPICRMRRFQFCSHFIKTFFPPLHSWPYIYFPPAWIIQHPIFYRFFCLTTQDLAVVVRAALSCATEYAITPWDFMGCEPYRLLKLYVYHFVRWFFSSFSFFSSEFFHHIFHAVFGNGGPHLSSPLQGSSQSQPLTRSTAPTPTHDHEQAGTMNVIYSSPVVTNFNQREAKTRKHEEGNGGGYWVILGLNWAVSICSPSKGSDDEDGTWDCWWERRCGCEREWEESTSLWLFWCVFISFHSIDVLWMSSRILRLSLK